MDIRRLTFVIVLVVIASVVAIQLLDPQLTQSEHTPVVLNESPSTVAGTTVQNLTERDFTYTMLVTSNRTLNNQMGGFYSRVKVENSDEEYFANVTPKRRIYANDEAYWVRDGQNRSWKFGMRSDYTYPADSLTHPFSIPKIQNSSGEVVRENESTLVIHLDTAATSMQPNTDRPGDFTRIYINKRQKQIDRVVIKLNNSEYNPKFVHLRVTAVDRTDVQRPPKTRPSLKAVVMDVLRGPLFRVP